MLNGLKVSEEGEEVADSARGRRMGAKSKSEDPHLERREKMGRERNPWRLRQAWEMVAGRSGEVVGFHPIKCGAAKLTNSRALTTFVAFQNFGKWRKFPVTR
jgi:hypothetical protein